MEQFVTDYINNCLANGISTPEEICNCAKKDIDELELKIKEIETLRSKQSKLATLIKRLGGINSIKPTNQYHIDRELCVKICEFISEREKVTISDIMYYSSFATIEENKNIYRSIKWLVENEYLSRDNSTMDKFVIKGSKWDHRDF